MRPTLPALLDRHAAERPDAVALIDGGRQISYGAFDRLCGQTAAWLARQGVGPGDRVAVWLVNRAEWLALYFGLARLGASLVAVNTRYRSSEVEHILRASGARMLVLQPGFRGIDFPSVLAGVDATRLPALQRVAVVDAEPEAGPDAAPQDILGRPAVAFDAFAQGYEPIPNGSEPIPNGPEPIPDGSTPEALSILFTTSGTTRGPKLVMHSQQNVVLHARHCARACGFEDPGARLLAAMPLCGVFGFVSAMAAFAAGAPIILMDAFDAPAAADLLRRHAVTHTFGSDEMFRRLAAAVPGHDPFPAARMFGFAAFAPGSAELARAAWHRRLPLLGLYGSSEVFALFAMQPPSLPIDERIEAGGRPTAPDAEVRIRDVESGALLPPGQSGEIEIRAASNFTGYLHNPEATAEAIDADGFFRTGDIGRLRADGTFVYETRKGDAIRLGGFLVNPVEIEDTLKQLPGISDAQVVAVEIGTLLRSVAFVIPASAGADPQEIIAGAAGVMAPFKVPARVWFVQDFPTTPSANGTKIQRARLREMAVERLRREQE